jgi:hypothetical protein
MGVTMAHFGCQKKKNSAPETPRKGGHEFHEFSRNHWQPRIETKDERLDANGANDANFHELNPANLMPTANQPLACHRVASRPAPAQLLFSGAFVLNAQATPPGKKKQPPDLSPASTRS